MVIRRIACQACGSSELEHSDKNLLLCRACGARYEIQQDDLACLACGTLNPSQAERCMKCGSRLGKQCRRCSHINSPGNDHCEECGSPLDTLAGILSRMEEMQPGSVVERAERLTASKQVDARPSVSQRYLLE